MLAMSASNRHHRDICSADVFDVASFSFYFYFTDTQH